MWELAMTLDDVYSASFYLVFYALAERFIWRVSLSLWCSSNIEHTALHYHPWDVRRLVAVTLATLGPVELCKKSGPFESSLAYLLLVLVVLLAIALVLWADHGLIKRQLSDLG